MHSEPDDSSVASQRAAEQAARLAYGGLIASLCSNGATIEQAEDATNDAFERALKRWPTHGIPESPEAWLLTTARRIIIDQARHAQVASRSQDDLITVFEKLEHGDTDSGDRRLSLMMLCAHPDIPANARAPLMLQTILGLTAQTMSAAFLVSPAALGQRLARAKKSIRRNQLSFSVPDKHERERRVDDVLQAIYAAFGTAYESVDDSRDVRHGLAHEAIWLGQILVHELPDVAEARGLLSLMLFVQSRVDARRSDSGSFVSLSEQNRSAWDWQLIAAAEHHLSKATALQKPGRFQIEAAIQSHHIQFDPDTGPDWPAICALYDVLVVRAPSLAAWVGRAAARGEAIDAQAGLDALAGVPEDMIAQYQPYWAVKAHLQARVGNVEFAHRAYSRAIGLCEDPAVRAFLLDQQQQLSQ